MHDISVKISHALTNIGTDIRSIESQYTTFGGTAEVQQILPSISSDFTSVLMPKRLALISIKIKNIYEYIHGRVSANVLNEGLRPVREPVSDLEGPRSYMRSERPVPLMHRVEFCSPDVTKV